MTDTRVSSLDSLGALATEQAGEIERLEAEHERFRAQAESTFREMHEQNMRLVAKVDALRNEAEALTLSLRLATREIERLKSAGRAADMEVQ